MNQTAKMQFAGEDGRAVPYLQKVEALWHNTASLISYHHADDSGKEWGQAAALVPLLKSLESTIKHLGGDRPTGSYLISSYERIEWEVSA